MQDILNGKAQGRAKTHDFLYRDYMTCEICGCAMTASTKKGHDYYYCTNGKGKCEQHKKYLRGERIEDGFVDLIGKFNFDEKLVDIVYRAALEKKNLNQEYTDKARATITNGLELTARKREKLLDSYLAEMLSKDVYEAKMGELNSEEVGLQAELARLGNQTLNGKNTLELARDIILKANLAKKEYEEAKEFEKRNYLKKVLWNLSWRDGEVANFKLKKPYQIMAEAPLVMDFQSMWTIEDSKGRKPYCSLLLRHYV